MARSRQTQAAQPARPTAREDVVIGFPQGVMHVDGIPQLIMRTVERLSSNQVTRYTAIEWADPQTAERRTSCNCPGWANRRQCKHTQELIDNPDMGLISDDEVALPRQITRRPRAVVRVEQGRELRGFIFD